MNKESVENIKNNAIIVYSIVAISVVVAYLAAKLCYQNFLFILSVLIILISLLVYSVNKLLERNVKNTLVPALKLQLDVESLSVGEAKQQVLQLLELDPQFHVVPWSKAADIDRICE